MNLLNLLFFILISYCNAFDRLTVGFFFFYKQKTAYVIRISDWSSDVCSSDLKVGNASTGKNPQNVPDNVGHSQSTYLVAGSRLHRNNASPPHTAMGDDSNHAEGDAAPIAGAIVSMIARTRASKLAA